jgi:hypothetical protein
VTGGAEGRPYSRGSFCADECSTIHLGVTEHTVSPCCKIASQPRFLAILMRWWARHSRHTQLCTYAAVVPCWRSSRQVAINAASSLSDHSWSVFVSPKPGWRSCQGHGAPSGTADRGRWRRGAVAAAGRLTAAAHGLVRGFFPHRCVPDGTERSYTRCSIVPACRVPRLPHVGDSSPIHRTLGISSGQRTPSHLLV